MNWMVYEGTVIEWKVDAGPPKALSEQNTSRVTKLFPPGTTKEVARAALATDYFGKEFATAANPGGGAAANQARMDELTVKMAKGLIQAVITAEAQVTAPIP